MWCPPRDSNSDDRSHWYLKPARMPFRQMGLEIGPRTEARQLFVDFILE